MIYVCQQHIKLWEYFSAASTTPWNKNDRSICNPYPGCQLHYCICSRYEYHTMRINGLVVSSSSCLPVVSITIVLSIAVSRITNTMQIHMRYEEHHKHYCMLIHVRREQQFKYHEYPGVMWAASQTIWFEM
jgi:hypothetical protein